MFNKSAKLHGPNILLNSYENKILKYDIIEIVYNKL